MTSPALALLLLSLLLLLSPSASFSPPPLSLSPRSLRSLSPFSPPPAPFLSSSSLLAKRPPPTPIERKPRKPKDDVIEVEGVVQESLPSAQFKVKIDNMDTIVLATISGKIRKNLVRILVGDRVTMELSPYDLTRGRITFRKR